MLVERAGAPGGARTEAPLVGRDEESALLESLVERVEREGRPHLVTVIGQAGVGKSRLLRELETSSPSAPSPPAVRGGQCPPYGAGNRLLGARRGAPRREFGIGDTDDSPKRPGRSSARASRADRRRRRAARRASETPP